jgi:hypothetical protein
MISIEYIKDKTMRIYRELSNRDRRNKFKMVMAKYFKQIDQKGRIIRILLTYAKQIFTLFRNVNPNEFADNQRTNKNRN